LLYLLDADTLIKGDREAYPLKRFPIFWDWLRHQSELGNVKVPVEQYEEVTAGRGEIVDWLCDANVRAALLLDEEADIDLVADTTLIGYGELDEDGLSFVGRDPFLIAYARLVPSERIVVSFEISKPSKVGENRKVPDVCKDFGIQSCTLFAMIDALDFTTSWQV
jgi:hypothetical protein